MAATLNRRTLLVCGLCAAMACATPAQAQPADVTGLLPGARLKGQGRMRFLGLRVYDARLWVLDGFQPERFTAQPVALELQYARALVGRQIAERSLVEMKRVGTVPDDKAKAWLAAMERTFPDVNEGDRITGLYHPVDGMRFFLNAKPLGDIADVAFAQLFIGIWLSPQTSEPGLRQALLGSSS